MSTGLIIIGCVILIGVVIVQIGRVTELAGKIRGEEEVQLESNKRNALIGLVFMIGFLIFCVWSAAYYKNWMLGYGPHESASAHGGVLDELFNVTVVFTGIVFILTQIALFWFAYKYRGTKGGKASFIPHNDMVEIIWTVIPAVVMCFLVVRGLIAWNEVMADIPEGAVPTLNPQTENEYIEIEATGSQFLWYLRYPGKDGMLGERDYTKITGINPLGQVWEDPKNLDDFHPQDIVLPVGAKVRVRITARDVLHNFDLPHFRVKMDAIPGIPTYFVFTPTKTTEEYRQELKKYPEYQALKDPSDPDSEPLWKTFEYELACAELCGSGHFSMKKLVKIVSQDEYAAWLEQQNSYYESSIKGSSEDPLKTSDEGLSTNESDAGSEEQSAETESGEES
jgi:cytochrome c oxidase subunit 2